MRVGEQTQGGTHRNHAHGVLSHSDGRCLHECLHTLSLHPILTLLWVQGGRGTRDEGVARHRVKSFNLFSWVSLKSRALDSLFPSPATLTTGTTPSTPTPSITACCGDSFSGGLGTGGGEGDAALARTADLSCLGGGDFSGALGT